LAETEGSRGGFIRVLLIFVVVVSEDEEEQDAEVGIVELCGFGSEAHTRHPFLRRKLHCPGGYQSHHWVLCIPACQFSVLQFLSYGS